MKTAVSTFARSALLLGLAGCGCQKEEPSPATSPMPAAARTTPRAASSGEAGVAELPREPLPSPLDHLTLALPIGGSLTPGPSGAQVTMETPEYALTIVDTSRGDVTKLKELMLGQGAKFTIDDPDGFVAEVTREDEAATWTVLRFIEVGGTWHKCGTPRRHAPTSASAAEEAFVVCGSLGAKAAP